MIAFIVPQPGTANNCQEMHFRFAVILPAAVARAQPLSVIPHRLVNP
jgi:hypothetical protein